MIERLGPMGKALEPLVPLIRRRYPTIEPVSQIVLKLHDSGSHSPFETARNAILEYAARRAGGNLPNEARLGKSFSIDEVGARRLEGIAIDHPRYWTLRFDDDDRSVAARSWVIETALAEQGDNLPILFGVRLQCVAKLENPSYDRTIPGFVKDVIGICDARLDGRTVSLVPQLIRSEEEVVGLVELLQLENRVADIVVLSLPEHPDEAEHILPFINDLAQKLAGAAHVAMISPQASYYLSDQVGREFSVFNQSLRTYRPGFNPNIDDPFSHPLARAQSMANWKGGLSGYAQFLIADVLRRTVNHGEAQKRLPSFAEAKRTAAEVRRRDAKMGGSSDAELLPLMEQEIEQLKADLASQKAESDELLQLAERERDDANVENQRLKSLYFHLQGRLSFLETDRPEKVDICIPETLDELESWTQKHLAGSVELHNRALRGAKESTYEDVILIYNALLLLRDYYVPMRRGGGQEQRDAFAQRCQQLSIEEQPTFAGERAGEHGDTYFINVSGRRLYLDRHLKKGENREPRYCFRLYFTWDEQTSQVIVGWLPSHLKTRAS